MMELIDPASFLQDATGWAAVLFVVRWMMTRMDRLIDGMQISIDAFQKFQGSSEHAHRELLETQKAILEQIQEIRSSKETA